MPRWTTLVGIALICLPACGANRSDGPPLQGSFTSVVALALPPRNTGPCPPGQACPPPPADSPQYEISATLQLRVLDRSAAEEKLEKRVAGSHHWSDWLIEKLGRHEIERGRVVGSRRLRRCRLRTLTDSGRRSQLLDRIPAAAGQHAAVLLRVETSRAAGA